MASTPAYLSFSNGFIPEATGQAIAYVRNKNKFKLNNYIQIVKCPSPVAVYAVLDPDQPVRVVNDSLFAWPDGQPRPKPQNNTGNFVWNEVRVNRRDYGYVVGNQAINSAKGWNPKAFFNASILSQAMTNVTQRFMTLVENTANWGANTASANALNGGAGNWTTASSDPASPNYLAIQKSITQAILNIVRGTSGMVTVDELIGIISPGLALQMANTSEIHDYLAKQVGSLAVLEGKEPRMNEHYLLPEYLYGLKLCVEDAVRVTEQPNASMTPATTNRVFIKQDTSAAIVSRPGALDGEYGSPSFSTLQRYFYLYEMAIESFEEQKDKLWESHVVDQFVEIISSNRSGFLITSTM